MTINIHKYRLLIITTILLFATNASQAQEQKVITFSGGKNTPTQITDKDGEIKTIESHTLDTISYAPNWAKDKPAPASANPPKNSNATPTTPLTKDQKEQAKVIDALLKERHRALRTRPPKSPPKKR